MLSSRLDLSAAGLSKGQDLTAPVSCTLTGSIGNVLVKSAWSAGSWSYVATGVWEQCRSNQHHPSTSFGVSAQHYDQLHGLLSNRHWDPECIADLAMNA